MEGFLRILWRKGLQATLKFAWDDHRKTQQITPEICQFAFAQAENLTNKWENMQKS